jgi:hypothetical protein
LELSTGGDGVGGGSAVAWPRPALLMAKAEVVRRQRYGGRCAAARILCGRR